MLWLKIDTDPIAKTIKVISSITYGQKTVILSRQSDFSSSASSKTDYICDAHWAYFFLYFIRNSILAIATDHFR